MKTPSYLPLLLLSVALPASAEIKPGERCDTAFLDKVAHDFAAGGIVTDADRIATKSANGMTIPALKFNEPKTCDAATWRHLASGSPLSWRNAEAQRWWDKSNAGPNASLLLIVSDFYKAVDPRAAEVLAAADAVIEAGAQLGFVTVADGAKPLSEVLKGASGGPIGAVKPKTVTAAATPQATIAPEQVGPTLRKLVDENGTKGAGDAVLRFRVAVLALNAELGRLGASDAAVNKRAALAMPTAKDFLPGLPKEYVAAKADKATALDDAKYASGLQALVGAGAVPALDATAARSGALLESVDLGLRNLVAIRSAQVDQIVAAAKKRLDGKKITDVEVSLRAAGESKKASNPLAAAVFEKLAQTPEYARLDALYENNKREKGDAWVNSTNGKAVFEERRKLKDAALSARIETVNGQKAVVYTTQGGKTLALGSLVPSKVEKDDASRDDAAEVISRFIVDGATSDATYQGVVSAIGGSGQPGAPLDTGIKGPEVPVSKEVPAATKKIRDGAAGCESPKDLIRNDYETYAARKRSAAADMASGNVKSRNDVEKKRLEALEASDEKCKAKKDEALTIKSDYFDSPAVAKEARRKAYAEAEAWCASDKKAIDDAAAEQISALAAREKGDRDPAKLRAEADADLAAAFGVAVMASVDRLRKDYTTPGNPRITCNPNQVDCTEKANFKLTEITHGSKKLTTFTSLWFATEWPTDKSKKAELEAAVASCSKALGLGDQDSSPSYHNPDEPDNIDTYCKVNEKITKYIIEVKGMNKPVP